VRRPADACAFDVDASAAAITRHRIFTESVQARAAVIPAHYPGRGGATLRSVEDRFDVDSWLAIERLESRSQQGPSSQQ
jgi:hypothetical protein